jgi:hypothetical protein
MKKKHTRSYIWKIEHGNVYYVATYILEAKTGEKSNSLFQRSLFLRISRYVEGAEMYLPRVWKKKKAFKVLSQAPRVIYETFLIYESCMHFFYTSHESFEVRGICRHIL